MPRSGRVDLDSLRQDSRARCLPRGDSYIDLLLWPRIRPGVPRERGSSPGHVQAYPWLSLTLLLEGSCRTLVEGQLLLPRGSYQARGPFPRYLGISVRGSLPRPLAGRVFLGGEARSAW
jgi:hypothetical protein